MTQILWTAHPRGCLGPRIALMCFQYYLHYPRSVFLSTSVFVFGIIRTLSCGGWVYITSSDDHDVHDVFMITYMVSNIPWMVGGIGCTLPGSSVKRKRYVIYISHLVAQDEINLDTGFLCRLRMCFALKVTTCDRCSRI